MVKLLAATGFFAFAATPLWAVNTKTTVNQVNNAETLSGEVDYIITSSTPFGAEGSINFSDIEHTTLILQGVKPSAALQLLADHVMIKGIKAQNGVNCQVKLYNRGCIIMPYPASLKPLTVYSEPNFGGEECNDFGLENSGGFMNTLSDKKLNNRIRSFRLKRGYMVTFALKANGRGYSRCFVAADRDIEMAELPAILDGKISSYRIFKWYDTGKQALANDTRTEAINALNVTSCYSFSLGEDKGIDCECVPHHIYEDWPSAAACGGVTYSPHMKTNNEPGNSADDHPQTVKQILDNWENLMATGMRLCSPSSHDGSLGHLREFLDSIDARGWRCDIVDLHCYWNEWNFYNSIKGWVDSYHRPIWISEWVWGSSWGNNGIFNLAQGGNRDNPTQEQLDKNKEFVQNICNALNSYDYIERYYYWNSEANCSKLYYDGKLTPAGQMYAQLNSGVGYNGKYDYAPKLPKQGDPSNLTVEYDKTKHAATLSWHEPNGELNQRHVLQRRLSESYRWENLYEVNSQDDAANYTYTDTESAHGYQYRVYVVDLNGTARNTKTVTALSENLESGDAIAVGENTFFLGGNIIINGDFDLGYYGWTDANGQPISGQPYYQVVPVGGPDGGSYLQTYGHGTNTANLEQSVLTEFSIEPGYNYYISADNASSANGGPRISLRKDATATDIQNILLLTNRETKWLTQKTTFDAGENTLLRVWLRNLGAKAQFDKIMLCKLFETQVEALADGIKWAQAKAQAFIQYNTLYPALNDELTSQAAQATTANDLLQLTDTAIKAYNSYDQLNKLIATAENLVQLNLYGSDVLSEAIGRAKTATTAAEILSCAETLQQTIDAYLPMMPVANAVKNSSLGSDSYWTVKCGTYTGGDQRTNIKDGVSFWNAWWSGISADEGESQTMEIRQALELNTLNSGYNHGLYAVECVASTEHYCLSDQHAFITDGTTTAVSPQLTADYYDLPSISTEERWQELTTMPIYLKDGETATIGFTGSKQGATDNAWHELGNTNSTGDRREGWWCATNFQLLFMPMYKTTVVPNQWGVICLPYALHPSKDITYYQIVGINPDYTQLCVEPIEEVEACMPVIYKTTAEEVIFNEYGTPVIDPVDAPGNLRGYLTAGRAQTGYYILKDGAWEKLTTRVNRQKYSALIRPIDAEHNFPIITDWTGDTMPINGVTPEEIAAAGISQPQALGQENAVIYTIDGRKASNYNELRPGIYVMLKNGKNKKIIVR